MLVILTLIFVALVWGRVEAVAETQRVHARQWDRLERAINSNRNQITEIVNKASNYDWKV